MSRREKSNFPQCVSCCCFPPLVPLFALSSRLCHVQLGSRLGLEYAVLMALFLPLLFFTPLVWRAKSCHRAEMTQIKVPNPKGAGGRNVNNPLFRQWCPQLFLIKGGGDMLWVIALKSAIRAVGGKDAWVNGVMEQTELKLRQKVREKKNRSWNK